MSGSSSGAERATRALAAIAAVGWGGWIWWLSAQSNPLGGGGPLWGFIGNSGHFFLFGMLALLLAEACRRNGTWTSHALFGAWLITLTWGIVDEWHQRSTPQRSSDPLDACVDALGGLAALAFWWGVRGPGRFRTALLRASGLTAAVLALNAARAWAPRG